MDGLRLVTSRCGGGLRGATYKLARKAVRPWKMGVSKQRPASVRPLPQSLGLVCVV